MYGQPPPGYGYGAPPQQPQWGNNPYAAPAPMGMGMGMPSVVARPGAGNWVKWAYLGCLVLMGVLIVAGMGIASLAAPDYESGDPGDDSLSALGGGLIAFGASMWLIRIIFGVIWVYVSWDSIPYEMRFTKSRPMSPGSAVGFLFVPLYNLYWIFVANVGLCDAIDYGFMSVGSYRRAPRGAAIMACVFQLIPYLNFLISPFTWLIFMFMADSARTEMLTALAQGGGQQQQQGGYPAPPMGGPMGGYGPPPGYPPPGYAPPYGGGGYPPAY